tara:strand:- start:3288 stop:3590 length:303 start_codon:yes stop_codon:yes gene_type:complete
MDEAELIRSTLYKDTGEKTDYLPANGKEFTLEELQTAVKGNIEFIYLDSVPLIVVVNENGLNMEDAKINYTPTLICSAYKNNWEQMLVGNVLITENRFIK